MEVESYSFGRIKIGGKEYTSDVIVGSDYLKTNWWRKRGTGWFWKTWKMC